MLLAATPGQLGTLPHMFKTGYKATDFVPVGVLSKTSIALVVKHGDPRFKSVEEFVAYAKKNPEKLNVGHAGPGSPNHLAMLQFENATNTRYTPVAYKGSGPALVDLLSGQIDVVFDQVSSSLPHLKGGKLSALLILGPTRDPSVANVRTLKEAGVPEFDASTYIGLLAPKNVPAAIVEKLTTVVQQVAGDAAFDRGLREIGSGAFYADPRQFAEILKADEALASAMIKQGRLVNE
jgi:tripartite-type tricarboxylate transporter receptor subunit TctC